MHIIFVWTARVKEEGLDSQEVLLDWEGMPLKACLLIWVEGIFIAKYEPLNRTES
jgi:hypothetical protein